MKHTSDGYVALLSVLIIGAAATAISLTLLISGVNSQQSALATQQAIQARELANGCAEEALQKVHDSTLYTGSGTLNLDTISYCNYTVLNAAGVATISSTGVVNSVVKKLVVYATINSTNITITSWQETS